MSRIDKYDPVSGGFRAPLAAAYAGSATPVGVALDANGRVVVGALAAGNTGYVGVLCKPDAAAAGSIVDIMTDGELVEFAGVAGSNYFVDAANGNIVVGTGAQTNTAPAAAGSKKIGYTVEATRLIVRINKA
jgi:hypothetical protein